MYRRQGSRPSPRKRNAKWLSEEALQIAVKRREAKGKGEAPSKMVGGAKSHLESNPIPARDAWRAQTNPVHTRTQRPHRD